MKVKNDLKNVYNLIAEEFSASRVYPWDELQVVIPHIKEGFKLLDLGCGNGRLIKILEESKKKYDYLGIDFSDKFIAHAKSKHPDYNFEVNDMTKIDYSDNSFDMIFMIASFHHLDSRKERLELLRKINRCLKPGGYLFMTNWNLLQKKYLKYIFKNFFKKKAWNDFYIPWQTYSKSEKKFFRYYHSFTEKELEGLLKKSNFIPKPKGIYKTKWNINSFVKKKEI